MSNPEQVTVTETTTEEIVERGLLGRLIASKTFKTIAAITVLGGAGFVAYDKISKGESTEDLGETLQNAAAALAKIRV